MKNEEDRLKKWRQGVPVTWSHPWKHWLVATRESLSGKSLLIIIFVMKQITSEHIPEKIDQSDASI